MAWKRNETSELLVIHHAGLKPYTCTSAEYMQVSCYLAMLSTLPVLEGMGHVEKTGSVESIAR
jgi:hypothetical protein